MVSLLHISDSHLHPLEAILKGYDADILIHSGDALTSGSLQEGHKFLEDWKKATKRFKIKIFSPGNHDITYGKNNFYWKGLFKHEADTIFLDTEGQWIENIYFWGHTRIPWITSGYWYGESTEFERSQALSFIPQEFREGMVLISHGPPYGELDKTVFEDYWTGEPKYSPNWGCPELRKWIYDYCPKAVLSGHIHDSRVVNEGPTRIMQNCKGTTLISNASICNEKYEAEHKPVEIEI